MKDQSTVYDKVPNNVLQSVHSSVLQRPDPKKKKKNIFFKLEKLLYTVLKSGLFFLSKICDRRE